MTIPAVKRYPPDFPVGTVIQLGHWKVTTEEIIQFATMWDPQYFHTDADLAKQSFFGGLVSSGLHTQAILHRLQIENFYVGSSIIAGRGIKSMRMFLPVRPNTILRGELEVLDLVTRPDGTSLVTTCGRLFTSDETLALEQVGEAVFSSHPITGATQQELCT
ncbi:MaoC family dehydratase [Rhodococcus olei]|uniref:MaoC family dehydratase n=1 Tax=Rhodococcus olei TaxID=2161675 RepID=A0ABP8PQ62_9NOCA